MVHIFELMDQIIEEAKVINNDALATGDDRDEILHMVDSLIETVDILSDALQPEKPLDDQAITEVRYQNQYTMKSTFSY